MMNHQNWTEQDTYFTRREFLQTTAAMGAGIEATSIARAATRGKAKKEPAALAALREKGKQRKRRLIYNNDGNDAMEAGAHTPEGFLSQRYQPILNTQADSVFYCTGATTMFTHLAKVGETYGEFVSNKSEKMAVLARDNIRALKAAGHDTLALAVEFCHKHHLEIFFSHRINDIHDTFLDWELSRWKREHPDYLITTRKEAAKAGGVNSPKHWWSALDFEKPEATDYLHHILEDVGTRYDVDGVEIDYFRSPMFFRPNLDFKPATSAQVKILTAFQRRIREMTYRVGTQLNRPILMATRVPATPQVCRHVGIDVARWLKDDLTDILTVGGGYVPFTEPLEEIIKLGRSHCIPVYPTISASGMRGRGNRHSTVEAWRGAASNVWRAGADGIVTFNIFPKGPEPRFVEMGSPQTLARLNKIFAMDNVPTLEGDLVQGIEQRQILPIAIPADGKPRVARLPIGDDIPAAAKNGTLKSAMMQIQLSQPQTINAVELRLNGALLTPTEKDAKGGWLTFHPNPRQYRVGDNEVSIRATQATDVVAVEVHVNYP
jgi:hypothetical protein